jgi:hypothetical protein
MKRYLLLTATIEPAPAVARSLAVADPARRRQEYEAAFAAYVADPRRLDGVILAENSGADLEPFRRIAPRGLAVELLNVPSRPAADRTGRGYLETLLVADAFAASELLDRPDAVAIKATGRYRTANRITLDLTHDLGFNSRKHPEPWVDMWLYFANARGMRALADRADALVEGEAGTPSERSMWAVLDGIERDGLRVQRRFAAEPRLSGVRAWDGRSYESPRQRAKWVARTVAKRVVPGLWI